MSYLSELRNHAQNRKRATPPSVESVEIPEGGHFDTFDTTHPGPFSISRPFADLRLAALARMEAPAPEVDIPLRIWMIRHGDGGLVSHSFTPPATERQVRAWHPDALAVEPEIDHE